MKYIHFITTPNSKLSKIASRIEEIVTSETVQLRELYDYRETFHVTLHDIPELTIPEQGCGGYTPSAVWMQIVVDEQSEKFATDEFFKSIKETVVHEFNHTVRWASVGYGTSLLESIISEGVATAFEQEYCLVKVPWGTYNAADIETFLAVAKDVTFEGFQSTANVDEYLFGNDTIPRFFGYRFGTYIVDSFRKVKPTVSWKDLTSMPAPEILEKSGVKIF